MGSWEEIWQARLSCHHANLEVNKNFVLRTSFLKNEGRKGHKHEGWSLLFKIFTPERGRHPGMFKRRIVPGGISWSNDSEGMRWMAQSTERSSM